MKAVQMDATVDDPDSHQKADVLVCDLPCSGLGVMGKKTDIRYKMTKEKGGRACKTAKTDSFCCMGLCQTGRDTCVQYLYDPPVRK